jgi:hypothetical protein
MFALIISSPNFAVVLGFVVAVILAGSVSPNSDGRFVVQVLALVAFAIAFSVALILIIFYGVLPALVVLFAKQAVICFLTFAIASFW